MNHGSIIDFKIIFISLTSIGTIQWAETFAAIYPILTKVIQLVIGILTVVYLIVKIRHFKK